MALVLMIYEWIRRVVSVPASGLAPAARLAKQRTVGGRRLAHLAARFRARQALMADSESAIQRVDKASGHRVARLRPTMVNEGGGAVSFLPRERSERW